ncbi:MAG TPA: deoxyribose-phosphate aldolase, partial [Paracoccaceae bacterium]|nr:deoxyribose-phosphate aldolase [Paracoccaceae bacterium]
RLLMEGKAEPVRTMVARVKAAAGARPLKAILETGVLGEEGLIRQAAELAVAGGADFLKTSTGKVAVNATPRAVRILLEVIRDAGRPVGLKPSGGVRSLADAAGYLGLADEIMGEGWAGPQTFRIGASGLLDVLVAALSGGEAPRPSEGY